MRELEAVTSGAPVAHRPKGARSPVALWVAGAVVAAVVLLAPAYLLIRTLGAGPEVWDILFRARTFWILARSLALVVSVTTACVIIAVPLAWLTSRTDLPFRRTWTVLTMLPLVIPSYVAGFLFVVALGPRGMLQGWLEPLGVDRLPSIFGFPGALFTLTVLSYPYILLPVRAALARMDPSLEEVSRSLGRRRWSTFRHVTAPQLLPSIMAGALLVALYTLSDFGAVSLLRFETFTWAIFIQYESALNPSIAASLSLVLVGFTLVILMADSATRHGLRYYRTNPGTQRPAATIKLGRWRWPALVFVGTITALALLLPTGILVYWVVRGVQAGEELLFLWEAMRNSLYVSGLAAGVALLASFPIVLLVVRHPSRIAALLERATYVGFALPGITVALAFVFFAVTYATPVYQHIPLLILAYVVLYLTAALRPLRAALLQINPRLEEAARSLGKSPRKVFISVTLPLLWRGVLASGALVFLLTMKELPATLVLSPPGFTTLATSIWGAASEAFFARAAASALLLIIASSVPMAIIVLRERPSQA